MEAGAYLFLYDSVCLQNCPTGYYGESSNSTCEPCSDGCKTCDGPMNTSCLTCQDFNGSAYYRWANETTCGTECPQGQFASLILNHQCDYCSPNCVTCVGRADNCTADGGCRRNLFFDNDTFQCVSTCANGQYGDSTTGFCELCADGCKLCFGPNLTECTKCGPSPNNASEKYYKKEFETECTLDCPSGYYELSLDYSCQKCHESCQSCGDNATDCPDCRNVTGIIYYNLNSNSCLIHCPDGYYGYDSNNTCLLCHEYCTKCFGPDEFSCTACSTNDSTHYYLIFGSNTCN